MLHDGESFDAATSLFTTCRCVSGHEQRIKRLQTSCPFFTIRCSTALQRVCVYPGPPAADCFFPSSFSFRAANNISRPRHIATQQIRADKTWNCCFDCGSTAPHFPAHSFLQWRGCEVQPASVFRFVAPLIKPASLFFSFLSSVWEPKHQKGQKGEPPCVLVGTFLRPR